MASTTSKVTSDSVDVLANGKIHDPNASKARPSRPPRPNYKHIHRFPLPVHVPSLPVLIPHNPLSLIAVALSYLTCLISPPKNELYTSYFCSATSSVHVTDPHCIRALWEMGFFGKGSLSRSEPSWLEREKKRRGLLGVDTSEEVTRKRREERREWKLERARKEREAITERLKQEAAASSQNDTRNNPENQTEVSGDFINTNGTPVANGSLENTSSPEVNKSDESSPSFPEEGKGNGETTKKLNGTKTVRFATSIESKEPTPTDLQIPESEVAPDNDAEEQPLQDEEHLQLSNEEAFFLVYGLGVLQVYDENKHNILSASSLLPLFRRHSYFPPRDPSVALEPDDPFIISYAVYHHFRSLGWVVRSGVKFGIDYLLYNRGPVFSHAEFALTIIPSYSHPYWSETQERRDWAAEKQSRTWWWLHCVNRVQTQVRKSLLVCYVGIPPPSSESSTTPDSTAKIDIGKLLSGYKIREISLKRWVPNRSRD
ncbi:hypothetical protein FQN54_005385 [Arachnomyces sp. PD_36]|nr:hypothetical protein FQN54_005385 [Arachnomyces sp. PD_36]